MNRFEYMHAIMRDDETFVAKHKNMKLYNGDQKVCRLHAFKSTLSNCRLN